MKVAVGDVIRVIEEPVGKLDTTVDTLLFGDASVEVTGIVTAFTASHRVLKQALDKGANLIITHEGPFYSHFGKTDWLDENPVYLEKRRFIEESGIAMYRFHDYWHRYRPDGIMTGLLRTLGWESYVVDHRPAATIVNIPTMTVLEIAEWIKERLEISFLRMSGNASLACNRIGILAGYRGGGALAIPLLEKENVDLLIVGEGPEWETPEYIRDAIFQKRQKALLLLGHAESEAPGMRWLAEMVSRKFPMIPVHYIPEEQLFQFI